MCEGGKGISGEFPWMENNEVMGEEGKGDLFSSCCLEFMRDSEGGLVSGGRIRRWSWVGFEFIIIEFGMDWGSGVFGCREVELGWE